MFKKDFEVNILVNGKPVQEYKKDDKFYIEGRKDTTYSIRIKNNSYRRIVAIPTVDGLSVIDGKEASYKSTGYIVNGNSSITIDGWRKSDKEVAQFYFSSLGKSYASKMNKGGNQGVIGVAIYKEKDPEVNVVNTITYIPTFPVVRDPFWFDYPFPTITSATVSLSSSRSLSLNTSDVSNCDSGIISDIGTGWGETKKSEVVNVSFERDTNTLSVFEFYYDTRQNLIKKGVDLKSKILSIEEPRAFPREYCEEPR
jgi:hypothetical protein